MSTLYLSFLWGLGASVGVAVGMIAVAIPFRWAGGGNRKIIEQHKVDCLAALERRNQMTARTNSILDRMADSLGKTKE